MPAEDADAASTIQHASDGFPRLVPCQCPLLCLAIDLVFSDALNNSTRTGPFSSVPTCLLSISHTARRIQLSLPFPTLFVCAL